MFDEQIDNAFATIELEERFKLLEAEALRRRLTLTPELEAHLYAREAARRGLLTYPTFNDYVLARRPELLRHEYIQKQVGVAQDVLENKIARLLVLLPTQYGKALGDDTPIATPHGWRTMGKLVVGDTVFGADGSPTRVMAVRHFHNRPTYQVTVDAGDDVFFADAEHEWVVLTDAPARRTQWVRRTTQWLVDEGGASHYGKQQRGVRVPHHRALRMPDKVLPLAPYVLGLWLGGGRANDVHMESPTKDAAEIQRHILTALARNGEDESENTWSVFRRKLWTMRIFEDKRIPTVYLRASTAQRLELLQGIVDSTAGAVDGKGDVSVTLNASKEFAEDVRELVYSLGTATRVRLRLAAGTSAAAGNARYVIRFRYKQAAKLRRKAIKCVEPLSVRNRSSSGRQIQFSSGPVMNTTCIQVAAPDGLFLAGRSMVVTHNSEIWSKLFPSYYLLKYPSRVVALASYGAELAWEICGDARDYYAESGGQFRDGSPKGSMRNWRTVRRRGVNGGMWATGIGGSALGRGYNLGIVDDPINPEQVTRGPFQKRFTRWWAAQWLRGQRPGNNAIIFVMQRLAPDDPVSWLLEREQGETAEYWNVLVMDEVHSDEPYGRWDGPLGFPKTCRVIPDTRKVGEVLAPKFRSPREVKRLQAKVGPIVAAAQRQQRPMRPTGDFWALKWFEDRVYDVLPPDAHNGGWDWDTAYSKEEKNSASAGVKSYRGVGDAESFRVYIEDVWWDWLEFPELIKQMRNMTGPHYVEKKASGKSAVQTLKTYGITADEVAVVGDKLARASAAQPAVSTGRIYVQKNVLQKLLYGEAQGLLRITAEALQEDVGGLDLNDAFVQSIHRHLHLSDKRPRLRFG